MRWYDSWANSTNVLDDPWLWSGSYDVRYELDGEELVITGETHRLYVSDPEKERQWGDVEVTVYFKRVADDGIPYSGMTSVVRTNHGVTGDLYEDPCDSRGLSGRLRNDGRVDFGKESRHPETESIDARVIWPDGLPTDKWIGYKHIVYDLPDGSVVQEIWIDRDADDTWVQIAQHIDNGEGWGRSACADGIDPEMALTNDPERAGSESGKPNLSVYFRADGLWEDGLTYKWASVREIEAPSIEGQ